MSASVRGLRGWPVDVGREADLFEESDQDSRGIDLAFVDTVAGQTGVGMVGVVPRIAETEKG